jgi:hypothetical protein
LGAVGFSLDFCKDRVVVSCYPEAIEPNAVAGFMKSDAAAKFIADSSVLNIIYNYAVKDFMLTCFGMFSILVAFQIIASLWIAEPLKEEAKPLVWEDWREPLRGEAHGRGLGNYRIFAAFVAVVFIALYYVFW